MNKQHLTGFFVLIIGAFILVSCGSPKVGAERVYWEYWEACSDGKFSDAELHLSPDAKNRSDAVGVCGYTHDAINIVEISRGNPARTFSKDPEVITQENSASLTWIDDQGNIALVSLLKIDDTWKILDAIWSY